MKRVSSNRSAIASIGYDEDTETLEVEFTGGTVYPLPAGTRGYYTAAFVDADSRGRYFAEVVRGAGYEYFTRSHVAASGCPPAGYRCCSRCGSSIVQANSITL